MIELSCASRSADDPPPNFVHVDARQMEKRMAQMEQLVGARQTEVTDLRGVVAELRRDGDAPGGGVDMFKGEMSTSYYAAVQRALVAENSTSPSGIGASPVRLALHTALVSFLISITLVGLHSAKDAMARRGTLTSFNDYAAVADQAEWADDRVMANSDSCVFYFYTPFRFIYDRIILVSVPTAFTVELCTGVVSLSLEAKIKNVRRME